MSYTNNINSLCEFRGEEKNAVPEVSLVECMRINSERLTTIDHMVNQLYTGLYGAWQGEQRVPPCMSNAACFTDEIKLQGQMISDIEYMLGQICNRLGV